MIARRWMWGMRFAGPSEGFAAPVLHASVPTPTEFAAARELMVREQLAARGIRDERVLAACLAVPRERFAPAERAAQAYDDSALPIAAGQTISQPYMVATMSEALALRGDERVLEVGTGSGYQAAILSRLAARVYTVERHLELSERAQVVCQELGYTNIAFRLIESTQGWPEEAPFDAIIVTAGAPQVPVDLLSQLGPNGRMVIPVGPEETQTLLLLQKGPEGIQRTALTPCRFVPYIGHGGWPPG
jgi:protein-L-isoaspartate(D-aspartate) O-methyltransferase